MQYWRRECSGVQGFPGCDSSCLLPTRHAPSTDRTPGPTCTAPPVRLHAVNGLYNKATRRACGVYVKNYCARVRRTTSPELEP